MTSYIDHLIGTATSDEPLHGDARLNRQTYNLNLFSIVFASVHVLLFLILGLFQVVVIFAAGTCLWTGARALMHRGHHDVGRFIQHGTGLILITVLAIGLGLEVNAQFVLLLAAAMPPYIWARKGRIEWAIHLVAAMMLWAVVESGLLDHVFVIPVSAGMIESLRIDVGLLIFGLLILITYVFFRENQVIGSRLKAHNERLRNEVHERVIVEKELATNRDLAQRANRAKDDFLANMSHEIRTPMNTIIGLARLCARSELAPRARDYINRVHSSSHALGAIINDVFDLSKIEAQEIDLARTSFDVWEVLEGLTDVVGQSASEKGLEFFVAVDPEVPQLLVGDPLRLGQVLTNLANNAIKFTANGSVVVRIRLAGDDGNDDDRVHLRFMVEDTGIGIPGKLIADLFESFVQADGSTTRRFGGSGLGLTISQSLVKLMGGSITVESEVGQGSCFSFQLTFTKDNEGTANNLQPPLMLQGLRVLVLDANPSAAEALRSMLVALSSSSRVVRSKSEALEALALAQEGPRPYGLLLVGWREAIELTRLIKDDPRLHAIPIVVMVSSEHRDAIARQAEEAGIEGLLVKPFQARSLVQVVTEVLGQESTKLLTKTVHRITADRDPPQAKQVETEEIVPALEPNRKVTFEKSRADQSTGTCKTWLGWLIGLGNLAEQSFDLRTHRRLANGLALVLLASTIVYFPIYVAVGLPEIAAITVAMGMLWLLSYALLIAGRHRSGRQLVILTGLVGCTAYALALGPRANYQALLFSGVILPFIIFTSEERRLSIGCGLTAIALWLATEMGVLVPFAIVEASDTTFALLHANAGLTCFGLLGFSTYLLAREHHQAERRLETANARLRQEIDERLKAEKVLLEAREDAEHAQDAKSSFLANMSHEIRTPLNAILGLTELCLNSQLTTDVHEYISRMRSSARTLLRIVNGILDLSRIEAHRIELEQVEFNLDNVLDHLADSVGHEASNKGLEFLVVRDVDVPRSLRGDPLRLEQVLFNLADNAVNATEQGEVVVRVKRLDSDHADKCVVQKGLAWTRRAPRCEKSPLGAVHRWPQHTAGEKCGLSNALFRFEVKDCGSGVPFGLIQQLSDPICPTAGRLATDQRRGPGLGLPISRSLVQLMGGRLQVTSEQGAGSTFWFDVPLECGATEQAVAGPLGSLAGTKILVFSSHQVASEVICHMLSSYGFQPSSAASPEHALELLQTAADRCSPFKVVVADCPAGQKNVQDVVRIFHQPPTAGGDADHPARLLLVTIKDHTELATTIEAAHFEGVLHKPVRQPVLLNSILAMLGRSELTTFSGDLPHELSTAVRRIRGARVLVAEDNEANQLVARGILESAGLRVELVANGREALETLTNSTFDLVLMDLHMPEMDGYEATRRARQNTLTAELPIVAMTADSQQETRQACLEAGMNGHVAKPVDHSELLTILVTWIEPTNDSEIDRKRQPPTNKPVHDGAYLPAELPGIDLDDALLRMAGNRRNLIGVLHSFYRRFRGKEGEIEQVWRNNDADRALELAHLIKGLAGNISAYDLYGSSARLEEALRCSNETSLPGLIKEQQRALLQVMRGLASISQLCTNQSTRETDVAGQHNNAEEEPDLGVHRAQLEELVKLLGSQNLKARGLVRQLCDRLQGTVVGNKLESITEDIARLDYVRASSRLVGILRRHGSDGESI